MEGSFMIEDPVVRPIAISPTRAFQRCNLAYRFGYIDNLRPIHLTAPLRMGIEAHKMQRAWEMKRHYHLSRSAGTH